ncbi:MAG: protein kinase, partial [Nitriliruptoraceae bacterium]|nr:protein kinase [Nitriliruptoraceae bacterium]
YRTKANCLQVCAMGPVAVGYTAGAGSPVAGARFRGEASAAAKLTHPNAVVVYDIGRDGDDDYIVMEYVAGATLAALLRLGRIPHGVVASIGLQVGRALGMAHGRRLVHRDIKPANVLVTTDGVVKVADFGIARALGEGSSRLTKAGVVMGTARYLAPEQLRDEAVDARADVYALGLVLHQCLTGTPPFGQGSAAEVAMRRLGTDLPDPRHEVEVPDGLVAAIARATARDPGARHADGAAFAAALRPFAASDAGHQLARQMTALPPAPVPSAPTARLTTDLATPPPRDGPSPADGDHARSDDSGAEPPRDATTPVAVAPAAASAPHPEPRPVEDTTRRSGAADGAGGPDATPPAGAQPRGRAAVVIALVALLAVAVVVGAQLLGGEGADPGESSAEDRVEQDRDGGPVAIAASGDHDPGGSGEEHPDRVAEAHDGDLATFWRTQRYRNVPELGGLKDGVGIWLTLEDPGPVRAIAIATPNPGADLTVYAGNGEPNPGDAPSDWGEAVGTIAEAGEEETITFDEPVDADTFLIWLTRLPPDDGGFRGTISEVTFTRP